MGDAGCGDSSSTTPPASRLPPPEKFTTPFTIGYSRRHTGQPRMPVRTMRPSISPVDITRSASSCDSGQRSISVSSMCTAELDPRDASSLDPHPLRRALAVDRNRQSVVARVHVADREVLPVHGVRMVVLAVRLGVRKRRLLRLGLDETVDPHLRGGPALRVPHLPGTGIV